MILVLEDVLYLVPFAILRSEDESGEFLSERCSLLTVPSVQALRQRHKFKNRESVDNINKALVVGVSFKSIFITHKLSNNSILLRLAATEITLTFRGRIRLQLFKKQR